MEGKPYSRNTVKANSFRAGQIFFPVPFKESRLPLLLIRNKYSSRQTNPSLKDLARQGLISLTKHQRPISGEDLEVLYAANRLKYFISSERATKNQSTFKCYRFYTLCFTDVNSETEIHFFLVKFMNITSENMNQRRQVFEFLIQGALRRTNFT